MNELELTQSYLPEDICLKIISSLQVSDVCSLGCCSKFWRELCLSDCLWESLCRERWPSLALNKPSSTLQAEHLMEAIISGNISERKVSVQWWKLGRWNYGFRLQDEFHSRNVSLRDLAIAKEDEVLGVLHRGAIHEVLRIQISACKPTCVPWSCQIAATQA